MVVVPSSVVRDECIVVWFEIELFCPLITDSGEVLSFAGKALVMDEDCDREVVEFAVFLVHSGAL